MSKFRGENRPETEQRERRVLAERHRCFGARKVKRVAGIGDAFGSIDCRGVNTSKPGTTHFCHLLPLRGCLYGVKPATRRRHADELDGSVDMLSQKQRRSESAFARRAERLKQRCSAATGERTAAGCSRVDRAALLAERGLVREAEPRGNTPVSAHFGSDCPRRSPEGGRSLRCRKSPGNDHIPANSV